MKQAVMETYQALGKPKKEDRLKAKELYLYRYYGEQRIEKLIKEMKRFELFVNDDRILPEKIADILNLLEGFMYYKKLDDKVQDEREYRLVSEINKITNAKARERKKNADAKGNKRTVGWPWTLL